VRIAGRSSRTRADAVDLPRDPSPLSPLLP
jgi:hypothetical protein